MWTARWQLVLAALAACAALSGLLVGSVLSWKHGEEIAELKLQHRDDMVKGAQAAIKVNKEARERFDEDLAIIATRPPGRTVLVCPAQATDGAVLPGAAPGAGAEAPGGFPPAAGGEARRDIGGYIAAEADRADRCASQLNALIDWINKVRAPE